MDNNSTHAKVKDVNAHPWSTEGLVNRNTIAVIIYPCYDFINLFW